MAPPPAQKAAPRVARPAARYRPGKAPLGAGADDYSDSDEDPNHHDDQAPALSSAADLSSGAAALLQAQTTGRKTAGIVVNEAGPSSKKLDLRLHSTPGQGEEEEGSSEYETDTDDEPAPTKPVFRKPGTAAPPIAEAEDSDSSEYETDSSEEESEEEAPKPLLKPLFVPKSARSTIPPTTVESSKPEEDTEARVEAEAARRKKEAHDLAAATIQRSLLQSRHEATQNTEVDDTDGLDPEAEFQAWRERELARLRRDRDALLAKQTEQREIEEFKSLPEAEKERLGRERTAKLRAEKKEQRGQPGFMQKYYHKGSFFQDMDILKRDYSERTEKEVDVSKLPKMMQRRGWGEKGRGKWTHLANEDTSKVAIKVHVPGDKGARGGCFVCGGDHLKRDCPKRGGGDGGEGSGANREASSRSRSWGEAKTGREEDRRKGMEARERSRSPRRDSSRRYDERDGKDRTSGSRRDDERSHHKDSCSHRPRDNASRERDRESRRPDHDDEHRHHSHRSHHDEDRSHQSRDHHRDDHHRSKSDRHDSDDRKHSRRHCDDEYTHDRHKRRDREGDRNHHHSSHTSSSRRHREDESDRKRSRLDT